MRGHAIEELHVRLHAWRVEDAGRQFKGDTCDIPGGLYLDTGEHLAFGFCVHGANCTAVYKQWAIGFTRREIKFANPDATTRIAVDLGAGLRHTPGRDALRVNLMSGLVVGGHSVAEKNIHRRLLAATVFVARIRGEDSWRGFVARIRGEDSWRGFDFLPAGWVSFKL